MNIKIVSTFALAILFSLVSVELLLRTFVLLPANSISDSELGWVYKPNSAILHTEEGYAHIHLNSYGYNDAEPESGTHLRHILALGDSYTEALQVPQQANFTQLAENDACVQIFNAGRSGASAILYPAIARRLNNLDFDQAVLIFSRGDLTDIKHANYQLQFDQQQHIVDIVLAERQLSSLRQLFAPVFASSSLATLLKNRLKLLQASEKAGAEEAVSQPTVLFHSDQEKQRVEKTLEFVFVELKKHYPVSLLYIPEYEYHKEGAAKETEPSLQVGRFFRQMAERHTVPFRAVSGFQESYQKHRRPPVGFANSRLFSGHLNEAGHRLVAKGMVQLIGNFCPTS